MYAIRSYYASAGGKDASLHTRLSTAGSNPDGRQLFACPRRIDERDERGGRARADEAVHGGGTEPAKGRCDRSDEPPSIFRNNFV